MLQAYIICAVIGGTFIVIQFVMTLIGLGGDGFSGDGDVDVDADIEFDTDVDGDHGGQAASDPGMTNLLFGILTFRTITAGLAFFGLTGWILTDTMTDWGPMATMGASLGVGLVSIFFVATIMQSLTKLNTDGTIRITRAVGAKGTVYLAIPGAKGGTGKVHVTIQGRMKEYKAITSGTELPTGSKIVVVKVVGSDTVEVSPAESLESSHA